MFNFGRILAPWRRPPLTPYQLALRDIAAARFAEALERLDALLADPTCHGERRAAVANKRGVALIGLRRREDAAAAFEQALEAKPHYAPALVNIGNMHLESGETDVAISRYQSAIAADDTYGPAHHNLSVAYKKIGRRGDAVRELRRAHRLTSNDA